MPERHTPSTALRTRREFTGLMGAVAGAAAGAATFGPLAGCRALDELIGRERTLVDDAGRQLTLPAASQLKQIYFSSPLAQVFCHTIAPDLLAGTGMTFDQEQLLYLPESTRKLDYLGSLSQGGVIDLDMLKYKDVQIIFSISGTDLTDVTIDKALELEDSSGIPVFLLDGSFERIGSTYRLLGEVLGREKRGEELASYCEGIYHTVSTALESLPANEMVRYLYAEGPEGLLTEPDASQHSLVFKVARGLNVAGQLDMRGNSELVPISSEQIIAWDPEIIICGPAGHSTQGYGNEPSGVLRASSAYAKVSAVRNKRVYVMPSKPFAFCDRPPGLNRFLGIQWLANLFYPNYYEVNMVEVVREFYAKCYWRELTSAEAQTILDA